MRSQKFPTDTYAAISWHLSSERKEVTVNYEAVPQGNPQSQGFDWLENFKYPNKVVQAFFSLFTELYSAPSFLFCLENEL